MERLAELAIVTRNGLDNSAALTSRHGDPCCRPIIGNRSKITPV